MYAYVNNKLLTPELAAFKEFQEWVDTEWPKLPESVIFKNGKVLERDPKNGRVIPEAKTYHQLLSIVPGKYGIETWHLCRTYATTNEKTDKMKFPDDRWVFGIGATVPKNDKELLFFLLKKFPPVQKKEIWMENLEKEAIEETENEAKKAEVSFLINSKKSILSDSEIRIIAMSWNIPDTFVLTLPEVKTVLFRAVLRREQVKKDGYTTFLNQVENLDSRETYISALIREAIDKKVILFNEGDSKVEWTENLPAAQKVIYSILPNDFNNWFEAFGLYLRMNDSVLGVIEKCLNKNKKQDSAKPPEPALQNQILTENANKPKAKGFQKGHKLFKAEKKPELV